MKRTFISVAAALLLSASAVAANKKTTVKQVGEAVTITENVDYYISGDAPFADGGSVNIENTDHAVLIFENIKPSLVLDSNLLDNVLINGAKAVDGTNCQVRMYAHGTIVLPYDKNIRPLTVYSEQNCQGESCNNFGLESSGGYMNTMNASKLNNRVRSFVLKRGYMVTFAVGQAGWGYSRCFIAHDEDLVLNELPAILDQRISSYRVFKWVYAQKKGLASNGGKEANSILNTSWCYDWAQGNASLLPDVEWVPNHIYEDYPSSSTIGSVTGSCHTKNNNEPANNSDDSPQSVETVLNNWQNMMRTGLRLCSPATHDGGWGWHNEFMDAIDARGWRCDIVDFHGYWDGEWGNLDSRIDWYAHGRPVWFSEWVWGASWNNNGIFKAAPDGKDSFSQANQQVCYNGTKPILDKLNNNDRVERYAYWNGEADASKILRGGELSILGKYYASMKSGIGYKKSREFIPKEPPIAVPTDLVASLNRKTGEVSLSWNDTNGDLLESIIVQCTFPGEKSYTDICTVTPKDQNSKQGASYSATASTSTSGEYKYRIKCVGYNGKTIFSETASVAISSQLSAGSFVFGTADVPNALDMSSSTTINNTAVAADLEGFDEVPLAFLGLPSYNNKNKIGVTSFLNSVGKSLIKFGAMPWTNGFTGSYDVSETMDYMVVPEGTYTYGGMQVVVGKQTSVGSDWVQVTFDTPFAEGETPVVVCQPYMTSLKYGTVSRVCDVTNTGFKVRHVGQSGQSVAKKTIYYIASTCGKAAVNEDYVISAGIGDKPVGGRTATVTFMFLDGNGETLELCNPKILCGPQTDRLSDLATSFRINARSTVNATAEDGTEYVATRGLSVIRQIDPTGSTTGTNTAAASGDDMGWICLSENINRETNPDDPYNAVLRPKAAATATAVYSLDGKRVYGGKLKPGVYVVKSDNTVRKILVRQ